MEFWDDCRWANDHMDEISVGYPDRWVAIVGRRVVASGPVLAQVESQALAPTGTREFPVLYAEAGIRVYAHHAPFPDED